MEYVGEKASLHELTKIVRAWERKVEIAEVCCVSVCVPCTGTYVVSIIAKSAVFVCMNIMSSNLSNL